MTRVQALLLDSQGCPNCYSIMVFYDPKPLTILSRT